MKEHPIFVPFGDRHLAAVITVPEGTARGVVALMTGVGAGRAHRFQVWARAARELAVRDIASVRFDWEGVGDSTGEVDVWGWGVEQALLGQAEAVVELATEVVGVRRTAAVGNCSGARIAMLMAAGSSECLGGACLLLPMVPSAGERALRARFSSGVLASVRRSKMVRRVVVRRMKERSGMDAVARMAITETLKHGRLLLLYGQDDQTLSQRTREQMSRLLAGLPAQAADRYELRTLPVSRMAGFDAIETQRRAIDEVVAWLDELFNPEAGLEAATA